MRRANLQVILMREKWLVEIEEKGAGKLPVSDICVSRSYLVPAQSRGSRQIHVYLDKNVAYFF